MKIQEVIETLTAMASYHRHKDVEGSFVDEEEDNYNDASEASVADILNETIESLSNKYEDTSKQVYLPIAVHFQVYANSWGDNLAKRSIKKADFLSESKTSRDYIIKSALSDDDNSLNIMQEDAKECADIALSL